ncbi:hypothetical protein BP5796_05915 [Coleophoma crateriformis]|uniref:Mediator of RNA polymerase II transcription subunit 14 n=1 Tax=Coleophoma crateriformis TaxID=565419 RepID=A0A3D8RVI2_9HELO|nr:hypothetical protein BP5796_05915 [Coleophoma crateriformis]
MPGVIMENTSGNGSHTNHDRDSRPNGINGASYGSDQGHEKGKGRAEPQQNMTPISPVISNGFNAHGGNGEVDRFNELPPEVQHLTEGYLPLSVLLARLAQSSHSNLTAKILQLAQMPLPNPVVNGHGGSAEKPEGNTSQENLQKKIAILKFAEDMHSNWTKALVLWNWSKNAADVSKMIDLRLYLQAQQSTYNMALDSMGVLKRDLAQARVPNPDLKTALEVLSTGKASWMPELGYIEPPPLTAKELLKTLENLNTLLTIRLNLHDYDKVPYQFKEYSIKSGRVTFSVAGEFEVDLTIADEDPESQFWFIDFRFLFSPSLSELTPSTRFHIESKVNVILKEDGLQGCYKYLHELVLTHKISEFRRQAVELARSRWIDSVKVEPLNRALCIQYWLDRYGRDGPKSWIIIGVHSGRRKDGQDDPRATSRLFIRWFRESKEVQDPDISFDAVDISAEALLKAVVAKHINYILGSTYDKLRSKALFSNNEAALSLHTSSTEPMESELKIQLSSKQHITTNIEPVSGRFTVSPASRLTFDFERTLNNRSRDPAKDAEEHIANLRCFAIAEAITSRGLSVGWQKPSPQPQISREDLKDVIPRNIVDSFLQIRWFKRPGWSSEWFVAVTLGVRGDKWWLFKTTNATTGTKVERAIEMPVKGSWASEPTFGFLSSLHIFSAALISQYTNLKALHERRIRYSLQESSKALPVRVPAIFMRLSELLPPRGSRRKPWARDVVKLVFQGLEVRSGETKVAATPTQNPSDNALPLSSAINGVSPSSQKPTSTAHGDSAVMITEARMIIPPAGNLSVLKERVDRDIAFHAESGAFAFRLRSEIGESVVPHLIQRVSQVERLVNFAEVVHKHEKFIHSQSISLGKIVFRYDNAQDKDMMDLDSSSRYKAIVDFSSVESAMTLSLEAKNPHIRILDNLTKILNSPEGLNGVATILPLTLPALHAVDNIETAWEDLSERGEVLILVRSTDWYIVRYNLFPADGKSRKIVLDVKLMTRRGEPWWYVRRTDHREKEGDDIDEKLKVVWNGSGAGWNGMRLSAVAEPSGVEECLGKVDEVIRKTLIQDQIPQAKPLAAPIAQMQPQAQMQPRAQMQPQAQMQPAPQMMPQAQMGQTQMQRQQQHQKLQQQRQLATPNSSQSQGRVTPNNSQNSQGRNPSNQNPNQARRQQPREIVEID